MAFFFKKFDKISYAFISNPDQKKTITNILTAFFLKKVAVNKTYLFKKYTLKDEDTIESLSYKFYNNTSHYWVFLIINDIIDPFSEWVKGANVLEKFVAKKYEKGKQIKKKNGDIVTIPYSEGLYGIHHFMNNNTGRMCDDYEDEYYRKLYHDYKMNFSDKNATNYIGVNIIPVTNLDYESSLDIDRRAINILSNNLLIDFEENFYKMLANGKSS